MSRSARSPAPRSPSTKWEMGAGCCLGVEGHPVGGPQLEPEEKGRFWTTPEKEGSGDAIRDCARHMRNFLDCVKSRQEPISDLQSGHEIATACHLSNISLKTGRKLVWNAERRPRPGRSFGSRRIDRVLLAGAVGLLFPFQPPDSLVLGLSLLVHLSLSLGVSVLVFPHAVSSLCAFAHAAPTAARNRTDGPREPRIHLATLGDRRLAERSTTNNARRDGLRLRHRHAVRGAWLHSLSTPGRRARCRRGP